MIHHNVARMDEKAKKKKSKMVEKFAEVADTKEPEVSSLSDEQLTSS